MLCSGVANREGEQISTLVDQTGTHNRAGLRHRTSPLLSVREWTSGDGMTRGFVVKYSPDLSMVSCRWEKAKFMLYWAGHGGNLVAHMWWIRSRIICHAMRGSTRHHCKFFRDTNGILCSDTRNFSYVTSLFDVSVSDEVRFGMCHRILLRKMSVHSTAKSYTTIFTGVLISP